MYSQGGGRFQSLWTSETLQAELDRTILEIDSLSELSGVGPESQEDVRATTWPLPIPDNYVEPSNDTFNKKNSDQIFSGALPPPMPVMVPPRRYTTRHNAWGNISYAELITRALSSVPERKLKLLEIYDWVANNVTYFKNTHWKNSIRHNLSVNQLFMRLPRDVYGKSWWTLNPYVMPRSAASTKVLMFEKQVSERKRVEKAKRIQNSATAYATPNIPMHSNSFQLSSDFRLQASSDTSSSSLSYIPSNITSEPDKASNYTYFGDFSSNSDFSAMAYPKNQQSAYSQADFSFNMNGGDPILNIPTKSPSPSDGSYWYSSHHARPQQPHGECAYTSLHQQPHALDHFYRRPSPPPPVDLADIMRTENSRTKMVTTSDAALNNDGIMMQTGAMGPTTARGQIIEELNPGLVEDINIESLEHSFDCNVEEIIKHELSMDGSLDFQFTQQHTAIATEPGSQFATTVVDQIMGAPVTGLVEDLNIESLEHNFDCNIEAVINLELSIDGSLDFKFAQ